MKLKAVEEYSLIFPYPCLSLAVATFSYSHHLHTAGNLVPKEEKTTTKASAGQVDNHTAKAFKVETCIQAKDRPIEVEAAVHKHTQVMITMVGVTAKVTALVAALIIKQVVREGHNFMAIQKKLLKHFQSEFLRIMHHKRPDLLVLFEKRELIIMVEDY